MPDRLLLARSRRTTDCIVIGAGHNGLVAGCYLAKAGLDVLVVEGAPFVGGMATTMPVVDSAPQHLFNLCAVDLVFMRMSTIIKDLELAKYGFREIPAEPTLAYLHPEGASICFWRDPHRTAEEITHFSDADAKAFLRLARVFRAGMIAGAPALAQNPLRPRIGSMARTGLAAVTQARYLPELVNILRQPVYNVVRDRFQHPMVQQAMDLVCSCANPIVKPGSAAGLMWLGFNEVFGSSRPVGGIGSVPQALAKCFQATGGTIRTSAHVSSLLARGGKIVGVQLDNGEEILARSVLSTADPVQTLGSLLPEGHLTPEAKARVDKIPTSNEGSIYLKVDIACNGRVELARHQAWRRDDVDLRLPFSRVGTMETTRMAQEQSARNLVPDAVPFGVTVPTAVDPSQAPAGQDTVYLYAWGLPKDPPEPWPDLKETLAERLVKELRGYYTNLESIEIGRFVESWQDLARRTYATDGNLYHVDMALSRMGPFRPAFGLGGYRTPVPGLFISGAGTHPGPGVSGVPGQLAAREVIEWLR
ncbi:phytoene desaturase family protein [Mycobacterium arosiense]|uniref:Pyridine nucleotide-disulfide oxidoreductase domain-containing protein 2 n=1 Tax=Mycobacterium arosiense ATCC BAA-1401 = DSM 45069 TaxID=1265311 RepID=A0A1W9ZCN7_MYCAI|nr:NAD(P)/FAD-dependent oxidoreductase [Mycobacterium arosiense]ORA11668.1 hypothetical protein BST14_18315 [Mycobacterium arosiense ATCC BAA-1401 = DSM 45069]